MNFLNNTDFNYIIFQKEGEPDIKITFEELYDLIKWLQQYKKEVDK